MPPSIQGRTRYEMHDRDSAELMHGSYSLARTHPADAMEPEVEGEMAMLGQVMARVNQWIANGGDAHSCGMRFLVMHFCLNPDGSGFKSGADIARLHRLERATVSKLVSDFRDSFGITTRPMRSERTRRVCREAQNTL